MRQMMQLQLSLHDACPVVCHRDLQQRKPGRLERDWQYKLDYGTKIWGFLGTSCTYKQTNIVSFWRVGWHTNVMFCCVSQ